MELALKDAVKDFIDPVDESLRHLFYMYKKLLKKVRELKNLHNLLKEHFEMFSSDIRPTKAAVTRWIDHRIQAMRKLVGKFGLCTHHLQNVIADTSKQLDRATLQGKFNKLIKSEVILRAAFLIDVLMEAKIFSLYTQKSDSNLIDIVGAAQSTKRHYVKLRKKMENDPEFVFTLPTLASMISKVKKDNDTES